MIGGPHTGSRRNEAAERAILRAAAELLAAGDGALITVASIAERAGEVAPAPDSGDLHTSSLDGHDSVVDQAFGLVWYRMIFAHQPLDERAADEAAAALATQLASPLGAQL